MDNDSAHVVLSAVRRAARATDAPLLLAVSGGLDSMALLVATARVARARIGAVATYDHGTGPAATAAAAHVARVAGDLGVPVVVGRMTSAANAPDGWEAAWRAGRHQFLREVAAPMGARVVTAHTADDQVETVLMRVLRGAGARGLAGLAAQSTIVRPFLAVRRATLAAYLSATGHTFVDDPSNRSSAFLRNRVRHDLLPALRRVHPAIDDELLATGAAAAAWRRGIDALVERGLRPRTDGAGWLSVASEELAGYDRDSLSILWGALAARVGLSLDRRGTLRLASFIMKQPERGEVPLSGGWCLEARPDAWLLRRADRISAAPATLPEAGTVEWGRFRFRDVAGEGSPDGVWAASLPAGAQVQVREWVAGDRLLPASGQPRRRVTRYLSDAGVRGSDRRGWPVVVIGGAATDDVVWIPGVRRSDAATERSGRPVRHFVCERIDS